MSEQELFKKYDEAIAKIQELKNMTTCSFCKEELETFEKGLAELKNIYNIVKEYKDGQRIKNETLDKVRETADMLSQARAEAEHRFPRKEEIRSNDVLGIKQLMRELRELSPQNVLRELGIDELRDVLRIPSPISNSNSNDTLVKDLFPIGIPPLPPVPYGLLKYMGNQA